MNGLLREPRAGARVARREPLRRPSSGSARRLRPGQDRAIAAGLAAATPWWSRPRLASLCYQAPAATLPGLTVVVSPLIALMADQLAGLDRAGTRPPPSTPTCPRRPSARPGARALRGPRAALRRARAVRLGRVPERDRRRARLPARDRRGHCVSEWGHEFRPDYRRVGRFRERLRPRATMALTATATARVRADVARRLGLRDLVEVVGGFDRPNLTFDALWVEEGSGARKRRAARRDSLDGGKAIVYCGTRKASEETAAFLEAAGHPAVAYHAGRADRAEAQEAFAAGRVQAVAATNAFGMGVNVPDVRLVIHTALPDSLELYQEAGRSRDGDAARHVIVAGPATRSRSAAASPARAWSRPRSTASSPGSPRGRGDGAFEMGRAEVSTTRPRSGWRWPSVSARSRWTPRRAAAAAGGSRSLGSRPRPARSWTARCGPSCRRHRSLDQAAGYVRGDGCRRAAFLTHFGDPSEPAPEERCDACGRLQTSPAAVAVQGRARRRPRRSHRPTCRRRAAHLRRAARLAVGGGPELGWPAFRVASNRTIAGIARAAPATKAELAAVRGVGPWLMEAHAVRLLEIVAG